MKTRLAPLLGAAGLAAFAVSAGGCACACTPLIRPDDSRSFAFTTDAMGRHFENEVDDTLATFCGLPGWFAREWKDAGRGLCTASELYGGCHATR